jgi:hypothetical protein
MLLKTGKFAGDVKPYSRLEKFKKRRVRMLGAQAQKIARKLK